MPQRAWLGERLKQLWTYERFGVPQREGGKYFFMRNDGTQDQSVLYVADALNAAPRVLVDPNGKRDDATIALSQWSPSPDGKLLAYALSDGGTDWNIWHFRRVADGTDLPVTLKFSKFWPVSWARDSSGRLLQPLSASSRARKPKTAERGDDAGRPDVYFHKLDEAQSADRLVYQVTDHPTRVPAAQVTEDGRYLIITLFDGYETNAVLRAGSAQARRQSRSRCSWPGTRSTTSSARRATSSISRPPMPRPAAASSRSMRANPAPPHWRTVVPHGDIAISQLQLHRRPRRWSNTRATRAVSCAVRGERRAGGRSETAGARHRHQFPGRRRSNPEAFFSYSDYLSPTRILRLDVATNTVSEFRKPKVPADFSPFVTEQVFYTSKDGTRVPMFITRRKDAPRDGNRPVMLYGYGGFNVTLSPSFSPAIQSWLEMGGIYAVANLRGGGEYGEEWHQAGTKLKKQNVFDDFIAAAEYLIREKYTNSEAPRDPRVAATAGCWWAPRLRSARSCSAPRCRASA